MIVERQNLRAIRVGAMPFHAVVLCGEAAEDAVGGTAADEFLRIAEPPAHNTWELTSDLKFIYAQGGGAAIARFFNGVRAAIREVVGPATEDLSDGPRKLKELFRMHVPAEEKTRRPEIGHATGAVDENGAWVVEARLRIHKNDSGWRGRPVVVFDAESGSGSRVKWANLEGTKNCTVDDDYLVIPAGARDVRFRGATDPGSHPVPAMSSAISMDLRNVEEPGA